MTHYANITHLSFDCCVGVAYILVYNTSDERACSRLHHPSMAWDSHLQADADRGTLHIIHSLGTEHVIALVARLHGRTRLAMYGLAIHER